MNIGDIFTCAETGKTITVAKDGCSFNYAHDGHGHTLSDEGVDIRQRRSLLAHDGPMCLYLGCDGKHVTGWKGNVLGTVYALNRIRHPWMHRQDSYCSFRVKDVHGNHWYGRGSPGMAVTIRPCKP